MTSPIPRSLAIAGTCLLALSGALFWTGTAAAQEVEIEGRGVSLAGGPLSLSLSVVDTDETPIEIEIFLDGRSISRQSLAPGKHTLKLDAGALPTGRHLIEVRTASGASQTAMRVLPGWLSIIPPLVAIALALIFRNVLLSLFLGVWVGALFLYDWNPFRAAARTIDTYVIGALTTTSRAQILVFTILLGGMVGVISKSGGTQGIVDRLSRYATTARRGQLAAWFMGILIFFDDYANTLIVGSTMRPITDRLKISREKLAYIVDSTAAPVVSIFSDLYLGRFRDRPAGGGPGGARPRHQRLLALPAVDPFPLLPVPGTVSGAAHRDQSPRLRSHAGSGAARPLNR